MIDVPWDRLNTREDVEEWVRELQRRLDDTEDGVQRTDLERAIREGEGLIALIDALEGPAEGE